MLLNLTKNISQQQIFHQCNNLVHLGAKRTRSVSFHLVMYGRISEGMTWCKLACVVCKYSKMPHDNRPCYSMAESYINSRYVRPGNFSCKGFPFNPNSSFELFRNNQHWSRETIWISNQISLMLLRNPYQFFEYLGDSFFFVHISFVSSLSNVASSLYITPHSGLCKLTVQFAACTKKRLICTKLLVRMII